MQLFSHGSAEDNQETLPKTQGIIPEKLRDYGKKLKDMMPYRAHCASKKVHKKQACSIDAMNAHRNFSWILLCPLKKNQQLHIVSNGIPFIVMQMWTLILES